MLAHFCEVQTKRAQRKEIRLPGEHGYRFYPAFYHNLDDQMGRIPVYDEQGDPTHRTVLDNLKPAPVSRFAAWDRGEPIRFPRKRPRSVEEFRDAQAEKVRGKDRALQQKLGL